MDVALTADVIHHFRDLCLTETQLDIAQYISIPSLSFNALLKESKINLGLITDYNLFLWIEKNLRGGYSAAHFRTSNANNTLLPSVDHSKDLKIITSQDFSALYGSCMTAFLPTDIRWASTIEKVYVKNMFQSQGWRYLTGEEEEGWFLEVSIHFPEEVKKKLKK